MKKSNLEELIKDWDIRLTKAQTGHYMATEQYIKWHYILGSTLIVLSAFVSSSLFLQSNEIIINNLLIISSISVTALAGLQTLISPLEKAEIHRSKASRYGVLRRKVELFYSEDFPSEKEAKIFANKLKSDWDSVAGDSPITPKSIRSKITQVMSKEIEENTHLKKSKKSKKSKKI